MFWCQKQSILCHLQKDSYGNHQYIGQRVPYRRHSHRHHMDTLYNQGVRTKVRFHNTICYLRKCVHHNHLLRFHILHRYSNASDVLRHVAIHRSNYVVLDLYSYRKLHIHNRLNNSDVYSLDLQMLVR